MNQKFIGVDIGGTTFSSAVFDEKIELINKSKKKYISDVNSTYELLDSIAGQINNLTVDNYSDLAAIGVSCPGPLDSENGIILDTPNLKLMQNVYLKKELEDRCNCPVYIENDANLFALGEWHVDSNKKNIQAGVTLGTGLGFGLIVDGSIYTGAHGLAMEYAISPVGNGNWESSVSIAALKRMCREKLGSEISPMELCNLAIGGNETAKEIWNVYGESLGAALCHFINMLDPHKISIGGGVSGAFTFFEKKMISVLKKFSPSFKKNNTLIFESKNKELSSMIGAGLLAKQSLK